MKIIITHQSNSISFEIEENLPEHEAFEVLRAFTVSAFENLPDPLVYSLSGASEPFQLQDPKDWKEGLQKHFRGSVICLTVVDQSSATESDDDSYVHITDSGDEKVATAEDANPEPIVDQKAEEPVIEDYDSEAELEDKNTDSEGVKGTDEDEGVEENPQESSPQSLCKRVKQFIVEIGAESLQNIAAVVHTLVTEGNLNLSDAIRTAVETSEKAANHPLTKDLLAILDVYVQKFQNQCNWHAMLSQFNIDQLVALIPGIVDALTRSMEGAQDVELDISPLMAQFAPMMLARMQSCIPNGEERVFRCNPQNPFAVFEEAREQIAEEFPQENLTVHHGISCDGCDASPIVGVRYKSVLRSDFDLCENCEKDHDPKDPLIKIKTPVQDMDVLPGLAEFRRSLGGNHRGRRCPRRGGRGRGWCKPRRGCRPCGPGGMARMAQMFQNSPIGQHIQQHMAAMQERYCQPQAASAEADHRDSTHEKREVDPVADKKAEVEQKKQEVREAKAKVRALKKEMKACRKEMKKAQKKEKKKKLDGEVTGHLDVDEKSVQQPGATVLKTWKVKNTGNTAWCEDTIAVFNSGNHSLVVPGYDVIRVGTLEPNDVAYIRCMLAVPEVEGTYSVTYRLSGPKGKFGGRLTTEIEVVKPEAKAIESTDEKAVTFSSEPGKNIPSVIDLTNEEEEEEILAAEPVERSVPIPAPSAPVIPKKKFQWQKQKDQLKAMGFTMDDETLESVLVVSKGDIGQAIALLM